MIEELHNSLVFDRRTKILCKHLTQMIPAKGQVLDVGCGDGTIDKLMAEERSDLSLVGIDVLVRPTAQIPVTQYDGKVFPHPDKSFDTVIFIDVLHHTVEPMTLLREAARVARKSIIIKDHNCDGFAAEPVLRFMDWIGNAPHGVALTYNYWPKSRWLSAFAEMKLNVAEYRDRLGLYPAPASWLFERLLHFISRLDLAAE